MKREIVIPLASGHTLRCGPGVKSMWGGYLCISDPTGNPIQYWDSQEWGSTGEEAEEVIGAIFAMAAEYLHMTTPAKFIAEVEVLDPDSQSQIGVSIFKLEGGPMMGVDTAFLDNTDDPVFSPYDRNLRSLLVNAPGYTDVEDEDPDDHKPLKDLLEFMGDTTESVIPQNLIPVVEWIRSDSVAPDIDTLYVTSNGPRFVPCQCPLGIMACARTANPILPSDFIIIPKHLDIKLIHLFIVWWDDLQHDEARKAAKEIWQIAA